MSSGKTASRSSLPNGTATTTTTTNGDKNSPSLSSSTRSTKESSPSSSLPPMLSPTLPAWVDEMVPSIPKRMLSPTLPAMFDENSKKHTNKKLTQVELEDNDSDSYISSPVPSSLPPKPTRETPTPQKTRSSYLVTLKLPSKELENLKNGKNPAAVKKPTKEEPVGLGIQNNAKRKTAGNGSVKLSDVEAKRQRISSSYSSSSSDSEDGGMSNKPLATAAKQQQQKKQNNASNTTNNSKSQKMATASPKTSNGNSNNTPKLHDIEPDQREKYSKWYRNKMHGWMTVAKEKKHEADHAQSDGEPKRAAAISLDSVLSFVVAFDYEDRADIVMKSILRPNSWYTLVPYMSQMIKVFDKTSYKQLMGLCYQIRALIYLRIAQSYAQAIKRMQQTNQSSFTFDHSNQLQKSPEHKNTNTPDTTNNNDDNKKPPSSDSLSSLTQKYISMQEASQHDFKRGFQLLSFDILKQEFPKTWSNKLRSSQPQIKQQHEYFSPTEDYFYLPLHTFSTLQEAAAFGYQVTKEWSDKQNVTCEWALVKGLD